MSSGSHEPPPPVVARAAPADVVAGGHAEFRTPPCRRRCSGRRRVGATSSDIGDAARGRRRRGRARSGSRAGPASATRRALRGQLGVVAQPGRERAAGVEVVGPRGQGTETGSTSAMETTRTSCWTASRRRAVSRPGEPSSSSHTTRTRARRRTVRATCVSSPTRSLSALVGRRRRGSRRGSARGAARRCAAASTAASGGVAAHRADQVALADGQPAEQPGDLDGEVALAELEGVRCGHAAAGRDDQQHGPPADGDVPPDQRLADPRRGLPVEVLDVVAADVLAQVVELRAPAGDHRRVLAFEQAQHPPLGRQGQPPLDAGTWAGMSRRRHGGEHRVDDRLGRHPVRERLEGEVQTGGAVRRGGAAARPRVRRGRGRAAPRGPGRRGRTRSMPAGWRPCRRTSPSSGPSARRVSRVACTTSTM